MNKQFIGATSQPYFPFTMASIFFKPIPTPLNPAEQIYSDIIADFKQMMIEDPVMKALWNGSMKWGDIPGILRPRNASVASDTSVASDASVASVASVASDASDDILTSLKPNHSTSHPIPPIPKGRTTIITRNLPRDITIQTLRAAFDKYGPIKDIYIPKNMDRSSQYFGTIKGFALIKFLNPEHSAAAYTNEYGRLVLGRNIITVEFAKEDR